MQHVEAEVLGLDVLHNVLGTGRSDGIFDAITSFRWSHDVPCPLHSQKPFQHSIFWAPNSAHWSVTHEVSVTMQATTSTETIATNIAIGLRVRFCANLEQAEIADA